MAIACPSRQSVLTVLGAVVLFVLMYLPSEAIALADAVHGADEGHKPDARKKEPAPPEVKIEARPDYIRQSSRIYLNDKGEIRQQSSGLDVRLKCVINSDVTPLAYKILSIDEVKTDRGEKLAKKNSYSGRRNLYNRYSDSNPDRQFSLSAELDIPSRRAEKIRSLTGKVQLWIGQGPIRKVKLGPFKKIDGKRVTIKNFDDCQFIISRPKEKKRIRVVYLGNAYKRTAKVRFLNKNGVAQDVHGYSGGGSNGRVQRDYRVKISDDGSVVLRFWDHIRKTKVPFKAKDIPLPGSQPQNQPPDLAIRATLTKAARAAEEKDADDHAHQKNQLDIEIEDVKDLLH